MPRIPCSRCGLIALLTLVFYLAGPSSAHAGGAWVPAPGDGDLQLGFSRKTAHTSWNSRGETITNTGRFANHDFRYAYLSGEAGIFDRLSVTFLITYLHGLEGPAGGLIKNAGPSDAWLGLKYSLAQGQTPVALALTVRTPDFYDIDGPYTLDLYNSQGEFVGHSPEWRGLLKYDYTLTCLVSRSLGQGAGWINLETGYTYREGAPADQIPVLLDGGYPIPHTKLVAKLSTVYIQSLGNDSPRQPDDRFGSRPGFNFNNASMFRAGVSLIHPLGKEGRWTVEAGYNLWLWGKSARQYEEPFLSLNRRF